MIRYLLDADLPRSATLALRSHGCQAADIRDLGLGNASDDTIHRYADAHGYVLVTADKGFTSVLRFHPERTQESSSSVFPFSPAYTR